MSNHAPLYELMRRLIVVTFLTLLWFHPAISAQDTHQDEVPERMPLVEASEANIVNFLLLGSDTSNAQNSGRTDVIMVISVNRTAHTIALLSIPRDLYVYIPGHDVQRINTVYGLGELADEGTGPRHLMDTLAYNVGLVVDYYARVDFEDFKRIIDAVGGVDVSVDCAIQDWRLRDSRLDPSDEANWDKFTLPVGIQHLDGDLALWYARSRRTSSDFDRGLRQQEIMRALWRRVRDLGLLTQLPDVWPQLLEIVKTDIPLSEMLSLVPLAFDLDESRIASYTFRLNQEVTSGLAPDGAQVLIPQRDAVASLIRNYLTPPTVSQLRAESPTVIVLNRSGNPDLGQVVADKLLWHGFLVTVSPENTGPGHQATRIYDRTGRTKGSHLATLLDVLRVHQDAIVFDPDPARDYDYEIDLGSSYYACTRDVLAPVSLPEAQP